jgi:hypothetical protein
MKDIALSLDIVLCVGVGLCVIGVATMQWPWLFGGTLIFWMGIISKSSADEEAEKNAKKMQDSSRPKGWEIPSCAEERRRDQEAILLRQN